MISNDDNSMDGKSQRHTTDSKGSMSIVTVGSRSLPLYPLVIVCLGVLNAILMLTAVVIGIYCGNVSEVSSPQEITAHALILEVRQLYIMQTEALKAEKEAQQALKKELRSHQQMKLQLKQNDTVIDDLQKQFESLQVEKAMLQSRTSEILESCGRCPPRWFLFNTSCFFHSASASMPLKSWSDSRADCISRGGSLTVIDNWEEQLHLFEYLPKRDSSNRLGWRKPGGIWIGLTDIQTEGHWMWVNNASLQGEGYWIDGQPNDRGAQNEDCVALMNYRNPRETWYDSECHVNMEWLCEKDAN